MTVILWVVDTIVTTNDSQCQSLVEMTLFYKSNIKNERLVLSSYTIKM